MAAGLLVGAVVLSLFAAALAITLRRPPAAAPPRPDPPAGPGSPPEPRPSVRDVEDRFEDELQASLGRAADKDEAIAVMIDTYLGQPINGVAPTPKHKWVARDRGCWLLESADDQDPRRRVLNCA